jgi:hypothetical protein
MAEDYTLTDPIVNPSTSVTKYKVVTINLDLEMNITPTSGPGYIFLKLKDNLGNYSTYTYQGQEAIDFMKFMNTANFSVNSMQKRILQKLSNDGKLPPGTVTGTPDPAASESGSGS